MHIFTPHHVTILDACYPTSAALKASEVVPKAMETSRLVYYVSNRPEKLQKVGRELEERTLREISKLQSGAGISRYRNLLLVSLALFRILVTECRQELSVLTPQLLKVTSVVLSSFQNDLELLARAASLVSMVHVPHVCSSALYLLSCRHGLTTPPVQP